MTTEQADALLATMSDADFDAQTVDSADDITDQDIKEMLANGYRAMAGRPSLTAPGQHSPTMSLRFPAATKARLVHAAKAQGRRQSDLIRDAVDEYLNRQAA
jgi:hypothetical protein